LRPDHASDADAAKISATERIRLDQDIREGIANDEFYPFYQPIVDLRDGSIAGFEALVRWRRTGNVVVSPGQFVALAEQTGAIVEIGRRVFSEAVQMLQELDELCERPLFMSINLSARQMRDTQELELLMNMVEQASVPARQIKLELTESMLIDDFDAAVIALDGFKRLGLQLAIDDFGTGYSSLSYLQRFALDTLKIDRSFVDGMVRKPDSERIVRAIAGLARDLGMNIVAEGIETREQEACLQAFGCEYGQGFLYSRPVDRAAALALMRGESSVRPD
jgi:EAL domain-containing protein (putative c-di-GMP-specific phosphodiesterase class I)